MRQRPIVRYHGGKWRIGPPLLKLFPAHRTYVEPFGGGASILLRKERSYAEVYNDLDGEIVNLFRELRTNGLELERVIACTPFSREDFEQSFEPHADNLEQARRTLVRAHMGFGTAASRTNVSGRPQSTGFRSNTTRSGSTPATCWRGMPDVIAQVAQRMQGVVIENRDAIEVMQRHDGNQTLHYVDPPYVHSTRSNRGASSLHCYRHEMTDQQHRELAAVLHTLVGSVVLSGYDCQLYRELFSDWQMHTFETFGDGARPRTEVLWIKGTAVATDFV